MGYQGIAWAHVFGPTFIALLSVSYAIFFSPRETRRGWSGVNIRKALEWYGIREFLKLGIPGIFSMSEWWFWESMAFMVRYEDLGERLE